MFTGEDYKFEALDDEENKHGFDDEGEIGISDQVDQVFHISDYPVEGTINFIKILTVKNNKFWIVTKENKLFTMRIGGLPELIDTSKFEGADIIFCKADEKGTHCVVGIKTDKPKYKIFYLSATGNLQKMISYKHPTEITSATLHVPTINNPDDRIFELVFGTNYGYIHHGRFYVDKKKGSFKAETAIAEIVGITPKRKIYDFKIFCTDNNR